MHVKIVSEKHGTGRVWIDGQEIKGIVSVSAHLNAGMINTVSLELYADTLEVEMNETEVDKREKQ